MFIRCFRRGDDRNNAWPVSSKKSLMMLIIHDTGLVWCLTLCMGCIVMQRMHPPKDWFSWGALSKDEKSCKHVQHHAGVNSSWQNKTVLPWR
jgi:hypothetical protein